MHRDKIVAILSVVYICVLNVRDKTDAVLDGVGLLKDLDVVFKTACCILCLYNMELVLVKVNFPLLL